ncbi:hypothetical protein CABS03_11943 [Colletotrichum abscissum]|uniref:Uncharacterized protein n=1 Tax=Colletotrichum abscissum TaxID=1671311 RepID=A0A9Q0B8Q0_9PEZI|nr:hypothetical protein CABS02_02462 [Colletotrichum abscissum]
MKPYGDLAFTQSKVPEHAFVPCSTDTNMGYSVL